jgi:hypothetical protein
VNFRGQVRWALTRGIGAGSVGVVLAFVTVIFELYGLRLLQDVTGAVTMALIAGGALLGLGGGIVRPAQRWLFLRGTPAGRLRAAVLRWPILRWWYWIDGNGQARDDG